ncbi:MAG: glycosyltransferase [Phycisphaerales bacterium]|nr:glycosyltransferase [Phycisphaerales bacterium]
MDRGTTVTSSGLERPVRVEAPVRAVRVAAVVPCFNRPGDLAALAGDLGRCELGLAGGTGGTPSLRPGVVEAGLVEAVRVELLVVVVDNASEPALEMPRLPGRITTRLVRLASNTGGSGGYNAGMAIAMEGEPDYLWLVDSDARVESDTLVRLLAAMEADRSIVVAGPVLADTETGAVQEVGGRLDRKTGRFGPWATAVEGDEPIGCDYVAACCALVRADAVRRVGLMPDVFLNADDVEWCMRLAREGLETHGSESRATQSRATQSRATQSRATQSRATQSRATQSRATESRATVVVVPGARAAHPRFDRFGTLPRYFGARNAFGPIDALGLGRVVRLRRAAREVMRAVNQHLMGRADLAALHIRGLRDAARGWVRGLPADLPRVEGMRPVGGLGEALRGADPELALGARSAGAGASLVIEWPPEVSAPDRAVVRRALADAGFDVDGAARAPSRSIAAFLRRAIAGARYELAVVPAKGSPAHWLVARAMVELAGTGAGAGAGFVVRRETRWAMLARCVLACAAGSWWALRIAARGRRVSVLPTAQDVGRLAPIERSPSLRSGLVEACTQARTETCTLSVVVLSYNRRDALLETLRRLRAGAATRDAEIIVVDNASADGSADAAREHAPWARLIALDSNRAIAGFNRGVEAASGELVLILDDDARPDDAALAGAVSLLSRRADLGAATLLPVHPATGRGEWPFGAGLTGPRDDWPVMGCCNLVRRDVWLAVGGYDESFFLYRNDVELALKILAAGRGVHFNPAWRCEHDSPGAGAKSARWCELATRNWVWLARRHGRGWRAGAGVLAGWAWAHKLAGLSARRQVAVVRGGLSGLVRAPSGLPSAVRPDGRAFASLLALRFGRGAGR